MTCLLDTRQGPDLVPSGTGHYKSVLACPTWAGDGGGCPEPAATLHIVASIGLPASTPALQPLLHTCAVQGRSHQPQVATEFCSSDGKEPVCNAGDPGSIPVSGRSPREGNGYPLQYSCLENPMDRGTLWATIHGVAKSQT